MNIFKKPTEVTFSAKDFIERKRNRSLYLDLNNGDINNAKRIGITSNGKLIRANNHSNLQKINKGYNEYQQNCEEFYTTYKGETFKPLDDPFCGVTPNPNTNYANIQGDIIAHPEMLANDPHFNFDRNWVRVGSEDNSGNVKKETIHKVMCFKQHEEILAPSIFQVVTPPPRVIE